MDQNVTTEEKEFRLLSKRKYINIVACFLIMVIALFVVANTMSSDENSQISADADSEVSDDLGDEILGDNSTTESNGIVYSKDTVLDAWNYAYNLYTGEIVNNYKGYLSKTNASLNIVSLGYKQKILFETQMDSNGRVKQSNDVTGFVNRYTNTYVDSKAGNVYCIESDKKSDLKNMTASAVDIDTYKASKIVLPNEMTYVIDETNIMFDTVKFSKYSNGYKYTFKLNLDSPTLDNYKKMIVLNSEGFVNEVGPTFTSIEISFTVNKQGYFKSITRTEKYSVVAQLAFFKGNANCEYVGVDTFDESYYNVYKSIQKPDWCI